MRILIRDLTPGTQYALQLRSNTGSEVSEWSRIFYLTTESDTIAPAKPTNVVGSMSGTSFNLSWDAVTLSTDGTAATDLDHYRVFVQSSGGAQTSSYVVTDTKFEFTLEMNRAVYGSPKANIQMAVSAVDKAGNSSGYTTFVSQTNAAPAAITGFTGTSMVDGFAFKWNASAETDLKEYRLYSGTTAGTQATLVWSGVSTSVNIPSIQYATDMWFRVVAVDVFNTESATAPTAGPLRPVQPFSVDTVAPAVPTGLAATLTNATDGKTAKAEVTWTAVTDTDNDLAEYIIGYKPSSETAWEYTKVDYTNTATTIVGLLPFTNYDFRIRSSDWAANLSAWSTTLTKTATANAAPATPTGLAITAGKDNIIVKWNANTEADMANGAGTYDVTIATDSGFTANVLQYNTGADNIAVNGLSTNQIYYARVRAKDSGGLTSAYAASVNATTGTYPGAALSDGSVPSTSPAANVVGGPNYLYVYWSPITNADPVIYDVYMSTTNGFTTYDATTKVGEISGTSLIIERTAAGAALAYGTTYYVKVRSRDRDGSAASAGTQGSGSPARIASGDITSVNADLITAGTSFTTNLFIGTGGAIQSTGYTDVGTSGFKLSTSGLTIKGSGNVIDASVLKGGTITGTTINVGAGGVLNVDSTASIKSNNYSAGSTGYSLGSSGLQINDGDIDAKALRTNTAIIGDLTIGRSADALGTIKSFDYSAGTAGWKIGKGLFEINQGTVKAAALQIQDSQNLVPQQFSSFEFVPAFYTSSANLYQGASWATVSCQTSGAKYGSQFFRIEITGTTSSGTNAYFAPSATDYNVQLEAGETYIYSAWIKTGAVAINGRLRIKNSAGTLTDITSFNLPASGSWQRVSGTYTATANSDVVLMATIDTTTTGAMIDVDGLQIEKKSGGLNTPSAWKPSAATFISGYGIRTGEIRSTATTTVNGISQPAWAINMSGNAQFGDALIRGKVLVGQAGSDVDAGQSYIASGNYVADSAGWKMDSAGNLEANTGKIRGDAIVDGTLTTQKIGVGVLGSNLIKNPGFEDSYTMTLWDFYGPGGPGNVSQWRKVSGVPYKGTGDGRSGNYSMHLDADTTAVGAPQEASVMSPSFQITAGKKYKVIIYACAMLSIGKLTIQLYTGPTAQSVEVFGAPPIVGLGTFGSDVPVISGSTATAFDYVPYAAEFVADTTEWAAIRIMNYNPPALSRLLVDDISVVEMGIGGASELTSAGLRLFDDAGEEAASFVSNRPNYISIERAEGGVYNTVASITSEGNAKFVSVASDLDMKINNVPLLGSLGDFSSPTESSLPGILDVLPRGLVGQSRVAGGTSYSTARGVVDVAFLAQAGRTYKVTFSGAMCQITNANQTTGYNLRFNNPSTIGGVATTPTPLNGVALHTSWISAPTAGGEVYIPPCVSFLRCNKTGDTSVGGELYAGTVRVGLFVDGNRAGGIRLGRTGETLNLTIEDVGPDVPDMDVPNDTTPAGGGNTSTSPKRVYTSVWNASNSESYNGSNVARTNQELYAGYYSSGEGDQYAHILFNDGAVSGDVGASVATIMASGLVKKVEVLVKNLHTPYATGMTLKIRQSTATTLQNIPNTGTASQHVISKGFSGWLDITNIATSTLRSVSLGPSNNLSREWFGYFANHTWTDTNYRPKLRITYEK